jgi:hypothetical protein
MEKGCPGVSTVEFDLVFHFPHFEGQICAFPPSSARHAPSSCVRRRLLVRDPLATTVLRCGVRPVATTRLVSFLLGLRVPCSFRLWLVEIGGFW